MSEFQVEICGICCHFFEDPTKIRTILIDAENDLRFPHFPHIEVQAGGVVSDAGLTKIPVTPQGFYTRGTPAVTYEAYRLSRHRISIPSIDPNVVPIPQPNFANRVPHLPDICENFGTRVREFAADVPATPVAAHVDITRGELDVFQSSDATHFEPPFQDPRGYPPGTPRPLATGVILKVNIDGPPILNVTPFGGAAMQFRLQPWVTRVRIGNLGRQGILGEQELDAEHFAIYYTMADAGAGCTALPVEVVNPQKAIGGGCANTQFP